jgi:hypothetical protein
LIAENTKMARVFKALTPTEMSSMSESLSGKNKVALDLYFAHHRDEFAVA